ncbi:carboxymuconolactone decarboxylase family protein [Halovulum dunhuangense]|uniref:Carboxymuconolactone decarboxylase family protein n=1 Tax=Halovulum dunhuangense TaxID=1505036 RepID=A0A849L1V0_9RHOB|nr:carboxymuconolactone decarboxylase family protein [Halovulum dunhuangense]NNU80211.1 carboxymuconolactone decarboxylase family protein [Halovulum dunhuangense]
MPTLAPLTDADWPESLSHLKERFMGQANVYRVMAHHPLLVEAWAPLRAHVVLENTLGPERLEVVILRIAHRLRARYEWGHHILRARREGLSDARIRSMAGHPDGMEPGDALLARLVDALLDDARLPGPLRDAGIESLGKQAVLDLMATVGFYSTLGFLLNSFDVPLDSGAEDAIAEIGVDVA